MEKCLYNGKTLYAFQVLKSFDFEEEIRKNTTLTCCDCGASVFFRHGKQRTECFAHRHKGECSYGDYCQKQTEIFKYVHKQILQVMEKIAYAHGFQLKEDVKIMPNHYTAFILSNSVFSYAIDIIDHSAPLITLEKRKQFYEEKGYRYLQITVDKNIERVPFSERKKAYAPIKFSLNNSINNTAVVIDEIQRDWSIYILDKTDLSSDVYNEPEWLVIDTLAMQISIDDIDINNNGFYTADSYAAFLNFCERRKKSKTDWIKAEQARAELKQKKEEEIQRQIEQQKIKQEKAKQELLLANEAAIQQYRENDKSEIQHIHESSGGYVGSKIKGKYEVYSLEQITSKKPICNWLGIFSYQDFEKYINEMQEFKQSGVRNLFAKMCFITPNETKILLRIYSQLKETDVEAANTLEYLMKKANINF